MDPYLTIKEGQLFDPENSKNTARRLSTIGAYKFVNVQYKEVDSLSTDSLGFLKANITLSPLNKRAFRAELQAVTKSNNFAGPGLAVTYSNRNLFKGGEILSLTSSLGYEVQAGSGDQAGLSSIELGLKTELVFPRLVFPLKVNTDFFKYAIPKTKTGLGINYLSRSKLYSLATGTVKFGYIWNSSKYITHEINPISINYTRLGNTTDEFDEILNENPFLRRSFEQQFIAGLTYSFTHNGMLSTKRKHQFFVNATVDIAGNTVSALGGSNQNDSGRNQFLGLEYAQYAKVDADVRYHWNFGNQEKLAVRLFGGYGYAYGNSEVLPFTKQFFSGGPYSVRAFRIRSLGPGSYNNEGNVNGSFFDQTGNIRLEANLEYRFPIVGFFKGAVFADAGNIWNSIENESLPGGKFSSNFISELGIGSGVGLRVDVQGFVVRFDLAIPVHDPSQPQGERFQVKFDQPLLNFAIGYPF
ncbi:BamA/TamA family outer membrane protein [Aquimarina agarivorans]|uniref:translocation and assembly module lipoprotein TamL n=1 Tax=Aquimarina agarivorans TaxID=980584 RepID=UPI0002EF16C9|nr:BamA/TamA family outer membrane protein [Aquimarina agarivorans]